MIGPPQKADILQEARLEGQRVFISKSLKIECGVFLQCKLCCPRTGQSKNSGALMEFDILAPLDRSKCRESEWL